MSEEKANGEAMNEISNQVREQNNTQIPAKIGAAELILGTEQFQKMLSFAEIMAAGKVTVPQHLRGNQGDCLAITMQSVQWGMNPFAVAQKTHIVNGALGYEAQLHNSVVCASGAIRGRFHYEFCGDWDTFRESGYAKTAERGCGVNVGAVIRGEDKITWLPLPVFMENAAVRNSPNWKSKPQQQLCYVAVRDWTRLYCPDVILGVYTEDELMDAEPMPDNGAPAVTPRYAAPKKIGKLPEPASPENPTRPTLENSIAADQQKALFSAAREKKLSTEEISFLVFDVCGVNKTDEIKAADFGRLMMTINAAEPGRVINRGELI